MWFDSHCHLHLCGEDAGTLVERAAAEGVTRLVTVGIDMASSRDAIASADGTSVFAGAGLHPNDAGTWSDEVAAELAELVTSPVVVAVGETGLDYYRDTADPESQQRAFAHQIALAKDNDLALIIHTRASVDAAIDLLHAHGMPERTVFHCWSGTEDELGRALALGAFVSFAGNVSFKNAPELRAASRLVPRDRLLVETDSPFLSPEPHRGRPNEPARVAAVGAALAAARSEEPEDVAAYTTTNAMTLFGLDA